MSKPILGTCDYCQNSNRQELKPYGDEFLCNRCLEDRRQGVSAVIKRERDENFIQDLKSIVGGVQT